MLVFQRVPLLEKDETKLSCFLIFEVDIDKKIIWTYQKKDMKSWNISHRIHGRNGIFAYMKGWFLLVNIPVVPHKAVAEVSRIGNV